MVAFIIFQDPIIQSAGFVMFTMVGNTLDSKVSSPGGGQSVSIDFVSFTSKAWLGLTVAGYLFLTWEFGLPFVLKPS